MAHEYGHALNLPELYDRTNLFEPSADYDDHSAGIGYYGSMGKGNNGYATKRPGVVDGPAPLSEWSRIEMDWITEQTLANPDGRLVKVGADMDLSIHDINSPSGKVYKIEAPYSSDEYFLLANRQNTYDGTANKGSYYDEYAPARGLLIYHVDENVNPSSPYSRINDVNAYEEHKAVDVECADGLRRDQATSTADPVNFIDDDEAGGDDLDYWTGANDQAGKDYRKSRRGNIGDAADMWTSTSGDFTPFTIPSTDGYDNMGTSSDYTDDEQTKFTGIVIRGITQNWDGLVAVEIRFIPSEPVVYFGSLSQGTGTDWYKVTLKWSAPEVNNTDIDRYEYSSNGAAWMGFAAVTEDTDTGVFTGTIELPTEEETVKYPFQVQAVTNSGEAGMPSAEVRFTLDRPGSISLSSYQPTVGDELEATPTDPNMLESDWDSDVSWQWQRRGVGETTWTGANDIPEATEASYMLTGDDKDMEVRATVAYDDEVGPDDEDTAASAPTASVVGPELVGPESLTFVEHGEEVVPTYTVSGVADGTATWSFSGPDKERFDRPEPSARSSQWQLHFLEPPNYEDARDHGGDNTYHVTIEATPTAGASSENSLADFMAAFQGSSDEDAAAQAATLTKEVIVEVIDGDDLGVVTLLPEGPPRVGKELTAVLEEEDGALPGTTAWTWKSSESIQGPWTDVSGVPLATAAVGTFVPYPELAGGRKMSTAGWSKSKVAYKRQLLTSAYRGRADHECWANAEWVVLVF